MSVKTPPNNSYKSTCNHSNSNCSSHWGIRFTSTLTIIIAITDYIICIAYIGMLDDDSYILIIENALTFVTM